MFGRCLIDSKTDMIDDDFDELEQGLFSILNVEINNGKQKMVKKTAATKKFLENILDSSDGL